MITLIKFNGTLVRRRIKLWLGHFSAVKLGKYIFHSEKMRFVRSLFRYSNFGDNSDGTRTVYDSIEFYNVFPFNGGYPSNLYRQSIQRHCIRVVERISAITTHRIA